MTLLGTNAQETMEGILRGTPNLKKLGIQIELTPDLNAWEPMSIFNHLHHLDSLESLKCVVVNPELVRSETVASTPPVMPLLNCLQKLRLSGLGYPREYMRAIGELPCLQVLKLECYAFRGAQWIIREGEFQKLHYLLIEDTDLKYLTIHNADGMFLSAYSLDHEALLQIKELPLCCTKN